MIKKKTTTKEWQAAQDLSELRPLISSINLDRLETGRWLQQRLELYQKTEEGASQDFLNEMSEKFGLTECEIHENLEIASLPERSLRAIEAIADPRRRNAKARRELTKARNRQRLERTARARPAAPSTTERPVSAIQLIKSNVETALWKFQHEGQQFDLAIADPPLADLHPDRLRCWVPLIGPVLEDHGQLLVCCPIEKIGNLESVYAVCGMRYVDTVIWRKTNPGAAGTRRSPYISSCEAVTWAVPERLNPMPVNHTEPDMSSWPVYAVDGRDHYFASDREPQNILEGPIAKGKELMSGTIEGALRGQKPEWLVQRLISRHCPPGGRVLDLFSGTGAVAVCCKRMGINCVSIERSNNYHELSKLRVEAA